MPDSFDLAIIGGGINGCGIARDAAGRGASVYLCEMNDLASGTSSWSTKLVHGGLRYLEYYEFRLVHEALVERERLWAIAPHIIEPLRLVLPHHRALRPAWLLRLGLFLYDHIGGRKKLPATKTLDLTTDAAGKPLKQGLFTKGFEFSDCRVDDARLVVLNAMDARRLGAVVETGTRAVSARRLDNGWELTVQHVLSGQKKTIHAEKLVNAGGPWVADIISDCVHGHSTAKVRLVQGSHIVVPKLYDHDRCYFFQNADGRIMFAIPYQGAFTLIGTTDTDYHGDPAKVHATAEDIAYLCEAASEYFAKPILPADVVWSFAGVRPLYDDGASDAKAATRDYVLDLDRDQPGLLSVFGGKITTYRRLAEEALEKLGFPASQAGWTGKTPLPGGDFPVDGVNMLADGLRVQYPFLTENHALRLVKTYGTCAPKILGEAKSLDDLGRHFGATMSEAEVTYLIREEWAVTAEDVLWRRTKLGLFTSADDAKTLEEFMAAYRQTQGDIPNDQAGLPSRH